MNWRPYEPERDRQAAHRIWYEVGWLRLERPEVFEVAAAAGRTLVAELDGQPECLAQTSTGAIRWMRKDLPFAGVQAVTTSRVGRRQGLAADLTARAVAEEASSGAAVAGLGVFDQGYYDRLGFGSGGYEHLVAIDPMAFDLPAPPRKPERLGKEHWEAVHAARVDRPRGHGGIVFWNANVSRADMVRSEHGFGLGYFSGSRLTHHLWCMPEGDNRNQGPFRVAWLCYRTGDELRELLALLGELGDQVLLVRLREPPGVQLQDFVRRPFRHYAQTTGARFEMRNDARAYWQMRICDLGACVRAVGVPESIELNLTLEDPIERYLPDGAWRGVGGRYIVSLGPSSEVKPGTAPGLPELATDVGTFTRLWLGVLPASGLAMTGRLRGPDELLSRLDEALLLPEPRPDWDF